MTIGNGVLVFLSILIIYVIYLGIKIVPQSKVFVIERFGKFTRILESGLSIIIPFIDRVAFRVDILERQLPPFKMSVITEDNVEVELVSTVFFRVLDAAKSVYRIRNIDLAIENTAISIIRSAAGKLELDDLQSSREAMNQEIAARLSGGDFSESLVPLGSGVNYVETVIKYSIGDFIAPSDFKQRFNNAVANRYFFAACGKLKEVGGVEAVKNKHWVKKLDIWYSPGDVLPQINSHGARTGVFVVVADDRETLKNRISWVYKTITFEIESIDD